MKKLVLKIATVVAVITWSTNTYSQTVTNTEIDSLAAVKTVQQVSEQSDTMMQTDSIPEADKRWFFGCGFGLNFVGGTSLSLSPNLNYMVSNKVSIGAGLQGNYLSIKDLQSTTTIGGNIIAQYAPTRSLTTLLEFSELNASTKRETPTGETKDTFWESALFIGIGYNITDNILLGLKYNVLYDDNQSVYTGPILPFVNVNF